MQQCYSLGCDIANLIWFLITLKEERFFLISNKFIDIKKGNNLVHKECTRGQTIKNKNYKNLRNQEKIKNDWFHKAANQYIKVLKKNSFKSNMDLSLSSKHLLFLSFQKHHNKQWGTINHINPLKEERLC